MVAETLLAQQAKTIQFSFVYGTTEMSINDSMRPPLNTDLLRITELKFYISKIQFLKNGKIVLEENESFHLIDANEKKSLYLPIENKQEIIFDELKFNFGIDSTTNVSGAMGGDLDPTKGMYWTWQSGYINFKLEGQSNLCQTRNNTFQFHLGGYQQPYYCVQSLSFPIHDSSKINLKLDIKKIFNDIDLAKTTHIMSPGAEAMVLSKIVSNAFTLLDH
jgi:hypothetical protein